MKTLDIARLPAVIAVPTACFVLFAAAPAAAESGLYVGGSIGNATVAVDFPGDSPAEEFAFDEDDFAYKVFGGYNFELASIDLGIEIGYVDLGAPSADFFGETAELETTALSGYGVLGFDLGPLGVFAKAGLVSWDVEASISGIDAGDDDGSDPAYGVGARFNLGSIEIRGEYEMFDIDAADVTGEDVYLLSVGIAFSF